MLLIVRRRDGEEEALDLAPRTSLRRCYFDGYWFFRTTTGGQVVLVSTEVDELRFGRLDFADELGRITVPPDEAER